MNKKQLLLISLIQMMVLSSLYLFFTVPFGETEAKIEENSSGTNSLKPSNGMIPFDYYQKIKIGENYIYNVSGFGSDAQWLNFTGGSVDWNTDSEEQIFINFTGFYNRDPNDDLGDTFPDTDMSWMNISIFESGAKLNYTNANVSNSEVSRNLKLGFADFQPGFLITVNHTDWIKANATLQANGASGSTADLTIEETYNFLYFRFEVIGGEDGKTELIYDRFTGLLVWANVSVGNYHLELFWEKYELDFDREYVYNILTFGPPGYGFWYDLGYTYYDTYALRTGSWIKINFTGYYCEDPLDLWDFDDFTDQEKRVWLDIKTVYKGDVGPIISMSLTNRSNQEVAIQMTLGVGGLVSGFLLETINNNSFDLNSHLTINGLILNGITSIKETDLTIKIIFEHNPGAYLQDTYLIYEKRTGLLLWADTTSGENYHLVMAIEDYTPPSESKNLSSNDDDDNKDGEKKKQAIPSFPLAIIFSISFIASLILIFKIVNKQKQVKKL